MAKRAKDFYNQKSETDPRQRQKDDILSLLSTNNWVKSVMIRQCCPAGSSLVDLCGGKGGDLKKLPQLASYHSIDISDVSTDQASERYKVGKYPFPATFQTADVLEAKIPRASRIMVNFALNYLWKDPARFLNSVYEALEDNGIFFGVYLDGHAITATTVGNRIFEIKRTKDNRYHFRLGDAASPKVDAEEYYVLNLETHASKAGFTLLPQYSFPAILREFSRDPVKRTMAPKLMTATETELFRLYTTFVMIKTTPHLSEGLAHLSKFSFAKPEQFKLLYPDTHRGQLKLLLSEMRFLRKCGLDSGKVVYVGGAPGTHIILLAKLFPQFRFVLFDPQSFDPGLARVENVRTVQSCFPGKWDNVDIFISDIRSTPKLHTSDIAYDSEREKCIRADMELQREWVNTLKPKHTLLKFRLPYGQGSTSYFRGKLLLQPFARVASTELRLSFSGVPSFKAYDHTNIEKKMAFFNQRARLHNYADYIIAGGSPLRHFFDRSFLTFDYFHLVDTVSVYCGDDSLVAGFVDEIKQFMADHAMKSI